jgi:hypothetical protein
MFFFAFLVSFLFGSFYLYCISTFSIVKALLSYSVTPFYYMNVILDKVQPWLCLYSDQSIQTVQPLNLCSLKDGRDRKTNVSVR